jgi:hypothetical protein
VTIHKNKKTKKQTQISNVELGPNKDKTMLERIKTDTF